MTLATLTSLALALAVLVLMGTALARLARPAKNSSGSSLANENDNGDELLVEAVNAVLPQTQCAQCGYPGCRPYAQAIITQHERINRCPPGGERTINELAELLGTPALPLDTSCGVQKINQIAIIDEAVCIGCTLCIHVCPVDAIVGAGKLMHTVIANECTGCELCLPPCPVDCIDLITPALTTSSWQWPRPA